MGVSELSNGRRVHSFKRRKLAPAASPVFSPLPPVSVPLQLGTKAAVCTSCHRAFPGAKQSQLVECARCQAPTCAICSRTCNGCPPSVPPTPELTVSPVSPVSSPGTPASLSSLNVDSLGQVANINGGRRPALASNTNSNANANMNTMQTGPGPVGKRRKLRENDNVGRKGLEEEEGEGGREKEGGIVPGCGRTVCRGCSLETPERDLNTCYDCAGRSPILS